MSPQLEAAVAKPKHLHQGLPWRTAARYGWTERGKYRQRFVCRRATAHQRCTYFRLPKWGQVLLTIYCVPSSAYLYGHEKLHCGTMLCNRTTACGNYDTSYVFFRTLPSSRNILFLSMYYPCHPEPELGRVMVTRTPHGIHPESHSITVHPTHPITPNWHRTIRHQDETERVANNLVCFAGRRHHTMPRRRQVPARARAPALVHCVCAGEGFGRRTHRCSCC